jgi:hypothetical protein
MGQRYHRLLLQLGYWLTERGWQEHLNAKQLLQLTQSAIEICQSYSLHKRYQKLQKSRRKNCLFYLLMNAIKCTH